MKRIPALLLTALLAGCAPSAPRDLPLEAVALGSATESAKCSDDDAENGIFYSSSGTAEQRFPARGVKTVEIHSRSLEPRVKYVEAAEDIVLVSRGTYSISGYHGSCAAAGTNPVSPKELAFRPSMLGRILILRSPEWRHLHHVLTIDEVELTVPAGIKVDVWSTDGSSEE